MERWPRKGRKDGNGDGTRKRGEASACLILDQEVDQIVQAALRHQDIVRLVDGRIAGLQGGHGAGWESRASGLVLPDELLANKSCQQGPTITTY